MNQFTIDRAPRSGGTNVGAATGGENTSGGDVKSGVRAIGVIGMMWISKR